MVSVGRHSCTRIHPRVPEWRRPREWQGRCCCNGSLHMSGSTYFRKFGARRESASERGHNPLARRRLSTCRTVSVSSSTRCGQSAGKGSRRAFATPGRPQPARFTFHAQTTCSIVWLRQASSRPSALPRRRQRDHHNGHSGLALTVLVGQCLHHLAGGSPFVKATRARPSPRRARGGDGRLPRPRSCGQAGGIRTISPTCTARGMTVLYSGALRSLLCGASNYG